MFQVYKPTLKGTGSAFSLEFDGQNFAFSLLKQAPTPSGQKKGAFSANKNSPDKSIYVKISLIEAASIICVIDNKTNIFNTQHFNSKKNSTIFIKFEPYFTTNQQTNEQVHVGYSLNISQSPKEGSQAPKASFLIGFTIAEAEVIKYALIGGIQAATLSKTRVRKKSLNNQQGEEIVENNNVSQDNNSDEPFS